MKKISFIIPVYKSQKYLPSCLASIADQDYPNIETIVVFDGPKEVIPLNGHPNLSSLTLPIRRKAPVARNAGAELSSGAYLSFLDPDSRLLPGCVSRWMEAFKENPDVDFVYGNYRFPDGNAIISNEFDPWLLETGNYISGSFPIKREKFFEVGGWDPKIKSLQDWDLWLNVVKSGGKGLYIPEIFFETELPDENSISADSHNNWLARVGIIKDKYRITDKEICVSSLGAPQHGKRVAKILGADFKPMPSYKPHNYRCIYLLGFYPYAAIQHAQVFANAFGKKVIHWIGTDIYQMKTLSWNTIKELVNAFKAVKIIHLCEFEKTQEELKELGIEAKILPLPVPPINLYPLPKKFVTAVYINSTQPEIYNPQLMAEIFSACPDLQFKVFGENFKGKDNYLPNVEHMGYIKDMESFIKECSAILRITLSDGLPISPVEFVTAGRYAILNTNLPYMEYVDESKTKSHNEFKAEIIKAIRKVKKKKELNIEGSKYYREAMNPAKFKERFREVVGLE